MATTIAQPETRKNPLRTRLALLRFRLRAVTLTRGLSFAVAILLAVTLLGCTLDSLVHLPPAARAFFLTAALAGSGVVAYTLLVLRLVGRTDDLSLALRIENRYPELNDALASTVQFLEQSGRFGSESSSMRLEASRRTFALIKNYDFNAVIDQRWLRTAVAGAVITVVAAIGLGAWKPATAATALARFAYPFGTVEWPKQTSIEIIAPRDRIGRNEKYEIQGIIRGVIPDRATVQVQQEGRGSENYVCDITREEEGPAVFKLTVMKDRSFRYTVRANDAVVGPHAVRVLAPPILAPLEERPSPQIHLVLPRYTGLADRDLPEGMGDITAPFGTRVTFRAAADRPLKQAWLELYPDLDQTDAVTFAAEFGRRIPAQLDQTRKVFVVNFQPLARGQYALYFEDDNQLWDRRYYELALQADPPPLVELEQPASSRQSLRMLPTAEFTLSGIVKDPVYSVRNVWLEYRTKKNETPTRIDLDSVDKLSDDERNELRTQRQQVKFRRTLKIAGFVHPNKVPLKVGDTLLFAVAADDFDDVTFNKAPGRSHEVEIQVIDRNALDVLLAQDQAKLQKEMVRLLEQQRDALRKQDKVADHLEKNRKLDQEHVDMLGQVEQLAQQIRERIGKTKDEGLRAEVQRLRETLKDNKLPPSDVHDRLDELARELDRLAGDELEQIEPRLSNARKQQESTSSKEQEPAKLQKTREELQQAQRHEKEVEKTLDRMLSRFDEVSSTLEHKAELKSILKDQRDLIQRTDELKGQTQSEDPSKLSDDAKQKLEKLKEEQKQLQERLDHMLDRLERLAKEKEKTDKATAAEIREAVRKAKEDAGGDIREPFRNARDAIAKNQLARAVAEQRQAAEKLEKLIQSMEGNRGAELDRLRKKLQEQQEKLEKLKEEQAKLHKKIDEAGQIPDAKDRAQALKNLATEQRRLKADAAAIQQELSKLSRLRTEQADEEVKRAAEQMEKALQRLERGQMPEQNPEDTLDRLDEAQRELRKAQAEVEEELAREQLTRIADTIRQFKERQDGLTAEAKRVRAEAERSRNWRLLKLTVRDLIGNQRDLSGELTRLADEKLQAAIVVARVLRKAADDMNRAAQLFEDQLKAITDNPGDLGNLDEGIRAQADAAHKLEQVVEALKQDPGVPVRNAAGNPAARQGGGQGSGEGSGQGSGAQGGPRAPDSGAIPDLQQLKLLKALQVDVNRQSDDFSKKHKDLSKLTPPQTEEIKRIRRDQQEVAELFEEMLRKNTPEGDKQ